VVKLIALAVVAGACGKANHQPATDPRPYVDAIRTLADRACACGDDRTCLHAVRDDVDAQKSWLLGSKLRGRDQGFDAELLRMRQCGDAGGLTLWFE
jgi:hypothetical protein